MENEILMLRCCLGARCVQIRVITRMMPAARGTEPVAGRLRSRGVQAASTPRLGAGVSGRRLTPRKVTGRCLHERLQTEPDSLPLMAETVFWGSTKEGFFWCLTVLLWPLWMGLLEE